MISYVMSNKISVGIIGAGAYGLALNELFCLSGCSDVCISDVVVKDISNFASMEEVLKSDVLIFALPSKFVEDFLEKNKSFFSNSQKVLIGTKGFAKTGELLSSVFSKYFEKKNICYLSGPGFANEIVENPRITRLHISGFDLKSAKFVSSLFCEGNTCYGKGVLSYEITSALKNIGALVCGLSFGFYKSINFNYATASIIYQEISRVVEYFGGDRNICLTSSLLQADLYMTTSQVLSRNFRFGEFVGKGLNFEESLKSVNATVESLDSIEAMKLIFKNNPELVSKLDILPAVCKFIDLEMNLEEFVEVLNGVKYC